MYLICVWVPICKSVCHMQVRARGGQKRLLDPVDLNLQAFVSYLMWAPGTKLGFSERACYALNHSAISPPPDLLTFFFITQRLQLLLLALCQSRKKQVHYRNHGYHYSGEYRILPFRWSKLYPFIVSLTLEGYEYEHI